MRLSDGMINESLRVEFGHYTDWILEAVEATGVDDAIAVACRGTADVALFDDLADAIHAAPGMQVLDVGCGMGGPAAWLRGERGCRVVGVDLMEQGISAGRRLFGDASSVVGSTCALPFPSDAFHGVWAVGVLELVEDKASALREVARVLVRGGRAALYSFVARGELRDVPASNHFVPPEEVVTFAMAAGLDVERAARASFAPSAERGWKEIRAAVETEIRRRHGHEPEFALVRAELGRFSRLRAAAAVEPWRFDLHRP